MLLQDDAIVRSGGDLKARLELEEEVEEMVRWLGPKNVHYAPGCRQLRGASPREEWHPGLNKVNKENHEVHRRDWGCDIGWYVG